MKFIFDVYNKDVKGIIEVNASDDQDDIDKVTKHYDYVIEFDQDKIQQDLLGSEVSIEYKNGIVTVDDIFASF